MFRLSSTVLFLLLALTPVFAQETTTKPKLVVLVVFDQMRGDYVQRWEKLFGTDGFEKMKKEGAWYNNCHYPYAITVTGAGHASMLTGTCPDKHGIIDNSWYDRASRTMVNCSTSARYDRVPPETERLKPLVETKPSTTSEEKEDTKSRGCPDRLLSPTVVDALKAVSPTSKAIGLSFKDRGAILTVGRKADVAYWLDSYDGYVVTSTYFRTTPSPWVTEINNSHLADQWLMKPWTHLLPDVNYETYSGPDDVIGEGIGSKQGRVFPHPMNAGAKQLTRGYFGALFNSPYGNDFLLELAKRAIVAEHLGQREVPDVLSVSFSSNDAIGHCWGPDSQEVMDVTLRSDRIMAEFIKFLDEKVGAGKYILALTADHGICPLPEVSASQGRDAKRVAMKDILGDIETQLSKKFGAIPPKAKWLESARTVPWIYLNQKLMASMDVKQVDVEKEVAEFLKTRPGVAHVYTRTELLQSDFKDDKIGQMMKRSFYPDRSGDIAFLLKPYYLIGGNLSTGTTHGTPYDYDTHVPLLVYGPGIQPGTHKELARPQQIASIFSKALNITPPKDAEFGVPTGLFK
ncbi:alkaline phosphatase family protein [Telmatocola sphagniphila]|uniref:Alkaline phosphatase family protein n=1 Tax=Telmatocola sphagniphila TaxID=1123043 RepID=A0A8E6B5N2_9BACT|nr:alkaline phosphatase family protein [Telmatocola sphagniphila]QVL31919.1 alkaline phosphatase family protein [Telmatocola sphagniphila]